MSKFKYVPAGEGKNLSHAVAPGEDFLMLLTSKDTDGALDFSYFTVNNLSGAPLHIHHKQVELAYVLAGDVKFKVGDEIIDAHPGDLVYVPPGVPHTHMGLSEEPAKLITVHTSSGFDGFMEEFGNLPSGPPDPDKIAEIAAKYDQAVVGPPLAVALGLI